MTSENLIKYLTYSLYIKGINNIYFLKKVLTFGRNCVIIHFVTKCAVSSAG